MNAPSIRCIHILYILGLLLFIVESDAFTTTTTTTEVSKVDGANAFQTKSFEPPPTTRTTTTTEAAITTTAKSTSIEPNVTKVFEVTTTSGSVADPIDQSPTTIELDRYDVNSTEKPNTTEFSEIEDITVSTVINTEKYETTTETVKFTSVESTTETIPYENENLTTTTTTIALNPSNDSEPVSNANATDPNGIFIAAIASDVYIYYKMVAPIVLRIMFGIIVSVKKVKAVLKQPYGIGITLFCNFFYMPLVSFTFTHRFLNETI